MKEIFKVGISIVLAAFLIGIIMFFQAGGTRDLYPFLFSALTLSLSIGVLFVGYSYFTKKNTNAALLIAGFFGTYLQSFVLIAMANPSFLDSLLTIQFFISSILNGIIILGIYSMICIFWKK